MEWLLVVLFFAALCFGVWLWDKLVDGATNVLARAIVWPFEKLFGVANRADAMRIFQTPQRFQLAAPPERVREVLVHLPGVTDEVGFGRIAPYYLVRHPQRVRIGVGNDAVSAYELEVEFTAGWPGTCGEVHYLRWDEDPADDMDIHRALLQNIFGALGTLDTALYVTTDPITVDTQSPPPEPAQDVAPPSPPGFRPGAGAPLLPAVGPMAVGSGLRRLPAIPMVAAGLFGMALIVGSCSAMGVFGSTTTPELCSAYQEAKDGFSYSMSDDFADYMDKENLGDELSELEDRANSYDEDDRVQDDGDEVGDLGDPVSESQFDSATTHIAQIC